MPALFCSKLILKTSKFLSFLEITRGNTGDFFELYRKVCGGIKAAKESCVCYRYSLLQHFFGLFNAVSDKIVDGGNGSVSKKDGRKITSSDADIICDGLNGNIFIEMIVDEMKGGSDIVFGGN